MTTTLTPTPADPSPDVPGKRGNRTRVAAFVAAAVIVVAGATAGIAITRSSSSPESSYSYYQSMMGRFGGGSMMGGSGNLHGRSRYAWMMGGANAPGWMMGGSLPGSMMGSSGDPGEVMGRLFADAPGPRVTPAEAKRLGGQVPVGAVVDRAANRIAFDGPSVHLAIVASPAGAPDETFRVAGLVNPTIVVHPGAAVTVDLVNADPDTAHGVVVTSGTTSSWMPMMSSGPAFSGSALWFLGNPTSAGMHEGTLTFTASTAGTYRYLCPVPGHAHKGMVGVFVVNA